MFLVGSYQGYWGEYRILIGPHKIPNKVVAMFSAGGQTRFRLFLVARKQPLVICSVSDLHGHDLKLLPYKYLVCELLCYLQMMWFCWFHHTVLEWSAVMCKVAEMRIIIQP